MRGEGSKGSPIVISDDEDGLSVERLYIHHSSSRPQQNGSQQNQPPASTSAAGPTSTKAATLSVGYAPSGTARDLHNIEYDPRALKRKPSQGFDTRADSPARIILENLDNAFIKSESKKARKKRRKLERASADRQGHPERLDPLCRPVHYNTAPESSNPRTWHTDTAAAEASQNPTSSQHPRQHPHASEASRSTAPTHPLPRVPLSTQVPFSQKGSSRALETQHHSAPIIPSTSGLPARPTFDTGPVESQSMLKPLAPMAPRPPPVSSSQDTTTPTQAPKTAQGGKRPSSGWRNAPSQFGFGPRGRRLQSYDPSRTLFLEQLPKAKRNRQFLLSWCQTVSGIVPVRMDLNTFRKEAVLEFESADAARTVFSKLLPQVDRDRSWMRLVWFQIRKDRRHGGEVEEGEIEDEEDGRVERNNNNESASQKMVPQLEQPRQDRGLVQPKSRNHGERDRHQLPAKPTPQLPPTSPALEPAPSELRGRLNPRLSHLDTSAVGDVQNVPGGLSYQLDSANGPRHAAPLARFSVSGKRNEQDAATEEDRVPPRQEFMTSSSRPQPLPSASMYTDDRMTMEQSKQRLTTSKPVTVLLSSTNTAVDAPHPFSRNTSVPKTREPLVVNTVPKGPDRVTGSVQEENEEQDDLPDGEMIDEDALCRATHVSAPVKKARRIGDSGVDDLRRLVLESKKKNRSAGGAESNVSESGPSSSSSSAMSGTTSKATTLPAAAVQCSSPETNSDPEEPECDAPAQDPLVLEELAVSFITETIQAMEPPPAKASSSSSVKLELAARQQQLEQEIAESKLLMARLTSAQTKREKDEVLRAMRERTRSMMNTRPGVKVAPPARRMLRWPESTPDGVLIVSDDESGSDESE